MTFDPTKPVRTRDGRPARILATDIDGYDGDTIVALITEATGSQHSQTFQASGAFITGVSDASDLVNVPERTFSFSNVYARGVVGAPHPSAESADKAAEISDDRIGLLKLTLEGSRLVNVEVV